MAYVSLFGHGIFYWCFFYFVLHCIACNNSMLFVKMMSMHTTHYSLRMHMQHNEWHWLGNGHQNVIRLFVISRRKCRLFNTLRLSCCKRLANKQTKYNNKTNGHGRKCECLWFTNRLLFEMKSQMRLQIENLWLYREWAKEKHIQNGQILAYKGREWKHLSVCRPIAIWSPVSISNWCTKYTKSIATMHWMVWSILHWIPSTTEQYDTLQLSFETKMPCMFVCELSIE